MLPAQLWSTAWIYFTGCGMNLALKWIGYVTATYRQPFKALAGGSIRIVITVYTLFLYLYGRLFQYGMSAPRALSTFVGMLLLGWIGVAWANSGGLFGGAPVLVIDTMPVAFSVEEGKHKRIGTVSFPIGRSNSGFPISGSLDDIPCGNSINNFLYAVDVFIPLVDLRQESVCRVSDDAWHWGVIKALYAFTGWIVTSLTILTVSGVAQRKIGE